MCRTNLEENVMTRTRTALLAAGFTFATLAGPAFAAPKFVEKQSAGDWAAYRLVGTDVLNNQAERIGKVSEVLLDAKGQATTVVIGVGGTLGIPEKTVAVSYADIKIGDVVQSRRVVVLDASTDALKAAPAFKVADPGSAERIKQKAGEWYKIAKDKVTEYSKAAADKAKEMTAPSETAPKQ